MSPEIKVLVEKYVSLKSKCGDDAKKMRAKLRSLGFSVISLQKPKDQSIKRPVYPTNQKSNLLTSTVIKYKQEKAEKDLATIQSLSEKLIYKVMEKYKMKCFPSYIYEEIFEDCYSLILLKSITSFDSSRGAFSTWFTYKLMSYIQCKKRDNLKKIKVLDTNPLSSDGNPENRGSDLDDEESRTTVRLSDCISRIYSRKKRLIVDRIEEGSISQQEYDELLEAVDVAQKFSHTSFNPSI